MIEILNGGMHTTVQDYPGRVGLWGVGVPPSGPMDSLAFRIGNKLVGNQDCAAGLEITLKGPVMKFQSDATVALTGAKLVADLDGQEVPWWETIHVKKGSVLTTGDTAASLGCRAYIAVAGGIDVPLYLGSRATFPFGNYGGYEGRSLKEGDNLTIGNLTDKANAINLNRHFGFSSLPSYSNEWELGVIIGPHSSPDYFTTEDQEMIFSTRWKVHYNSNRLGYRLQGPKPKFARPDGGEGGAHPSNLVDYTYAIGTINFTGNMPIVITVDGPSLGGFVSHATIATSEQWKVGQARPGNFVRFKKISIEEALNLQRWQNSMIDGITPTC
jgi:urea carboxylase